MSAKGGVRGWSGPSAGGDPEPAAEACQHTLPLGTRDALTREPLPARAPALQCGACEAAYGAASQQLLANQGKRCARCGEHAAWRWAVVLAGHGKAPLAQPEPASRPGRAADPIGWRELAAAGPPPPAGAAPPRAHEPPPAVPAQHRIGCVLEVAPPATLDRTPAGLEQAPIGCVRPSPPQAQEPPAVALEPGRAHEQLRPYQGREIRLRARPLRVRPSRRGGTVFLDLSAERAHARCLKIVLRPEAAAGLRAQGIEPLQLAGQLLEVRAVYEHHPVFGPQLFCRSAAQLRLPSPLASPAGDAGAPSLPPPWAWLLESYEYPSGYHVSAQASLPPPCARSLESCEAEDRP
ncbi:MAG: hypothetical protein KatS3mg102_1528 [Planctomycetota bacterium]|nr:MAG: hypothetical protein KatS3mg102_1528 [Planctomycetota bacterium]